VSAPVAPAEDSQVKQVVSTVAHRVTIAQARASAAQPEDPRQFQVLCSLGRQQKVLTATAEAFDNEARILEKQQQGVMPTVDPESPTASSVLVATAQQVVYQAARQVQSERNGTLFFASEPLTVQDVSEATQSVLAQAVEITSPLSSEVEVMMTANAIMQHNMAQTMAAPLNPTGVSPLGPIPSSASAPDLTTTPMTHAFPVTPGIGPPPSVTFPEMGLAAEVQLGGYDTTLAQ
jgi:hypothetical protein